MQRHGHITFSQTPEAHLFPIVLCSNAQCRGSLFLCIKKCRWPVSTNIKMENHARESPKIGKIGINSCSHVAQYVARCLDYWRFSCNSEGLGICVVLNKRVRVDMLWMLDGMRINMMLFFYGQGVNLSVNCCPFAQAVHVASLQSQVRGGGQPCEMCALSI